MWCKINGYLMVHKLFSTKKKEEFIKISPVQMNKKIEFLKISHGSNSIRAL